MTSNKMMNAAYKRLGRSRWSAFFYYFLRVPKKKKDGKEEGAGHRIRELSFIYDIVRSELLEKAMLHDYILTSLIVYIAQNI